MKLISMVDFVLEFGKEQNRCNYEEAYDKISAYARFLKQPLELWMFVPCDENGNVLEEPKNYKEWCKKSLNTPYDLDLSKYEIYQQTKEQVLFEGFYYRGKSKTISDGVFTFSIFHLKSETIEDLIEYNFTLTTTAIKQLGL